MGADVDVVTHDDLAASSLCARWREVVDADPGASPFQGPDWVATWSRLRAPGPTVVRCFEDDGRCVGVVAEVDLGDGRRTVAGGRDVTDYRGPVAAPADRAAVARAWIDALAGDDVAEVDLHGIASDTGWLDHLATAAEAGGWSLQDRRVEDVCPVVDLTGDEPQAWLERIDGRERHELRRKTRKLARDLGGMQVVEVPRDQLGAGLDRFWEMALTSAGEKGGFFDDPDMRAFFDAVTASLGATGELRIHELLVGGLPAASMVSVVHGSTWGLYNSAFDDTLAAFAPGTVLAAELATAAAAEGCTSFDFLRGDEAYKYRFGAVDRAIEQARLVRD